MSSRMSKGKGREERSIWSRWSDWSDQIWDENRGQFYSYRGRTHRITGEIDYEYRYQEASEPVASAPAIRDTGLQYSKAQPSYSLGSKENDFEVISNPPRFFTKGRVFKCLWIEPAGNSTDEDDEFVISTKFGERAYTKVRRFVVVRAMRGCCLCLPLNTYNRQGAGKDGIRIQDYAAVYDQARGPSPTSNGENLTKDPFPIIVEDPQEKIDAMSLLNFGRVYTVEHNFKVKKIGRIPDEFHTQLDEYFVENIAGPSYEYDSLTPGSPKNMDSYSKAPPNSQSYERLAQQDPLSGFLSQSSPTIAPVSGSNYLTSSAPYTSSYWPAWASSSSFNQPSSAQSAYGDQSGSSFNQTSPAQSAYPGQFNSSRPVDPTVTMSLEDQFSSTRISGPSYNDPGTSLAYLSATDESTKYPEPKGTGAVPVYREGNIHRAPGSGNSEALDPRYRVVAPKNYDAFWKLGRVFMMLWTEPTRARTGRADLPDNASRLSFVWLNETVYSEIRRFVVVSNLYGFCLCLAIRSYNGQATLKKRLPDPENHAIIYTASKPPPLHSITLSNGTRVEEDLQHAPIKVNSEQPGSEGQLESTCRIHYGKVYTVEKDIRVLNIGMVAKESIPDLTASSPVKNKSAEYKKKTK